MRIELDLDFDDNDFISEEQVGYDLLICSIKELMEEGFTLSQVGDILGVSQPYVSKLLKQTVNIGVETLHDYLQAIDAFESARKDG